MHLQSRETRLTHYPRIGEVEWSKIKGHFPVRYLSLTSDPHTGTVTTSGFELCEGKGERMKIFILPP